MRNPFSIARVLTAEFDSTAYADIPKPVPQGDEPEDQVTRTLDRWGDLRTPRSMRL